MQVFTTIELYGGNVTSCCWNAKRFRSGSSDTSFDRQREAILVRGARTPIKIVTCKHAVDYKMTWSRICPEAFFYHLLKLSDANLGSTLKMISLFFFAIVVQEMLIKHFSLFNNKTVVKFLYSPH